MQRAPSGAFCFNSIQLWKLLDESFLSVLRIHNRYKSIFATKKMIRSFQIVCFLEGLSYILLLFIGVPLKYYGNNEILVKLLGMPHGILFIAYVIMAFLVRPKFSWKTLDFLFILLASLLPFATFYVEKKYLKK